MPLLTGELYSGKYASIFPGSLSARTYLRIENALVERFMAYYLEPIQALLNNAGVAVDIDETAAMWKRLIGTQLHDCIGGVSVDQVHDQMESTYQALYRQTQARLEQMMGFLPELLNLEPGTYAFFPSPYAYQDLWFRHGQSASQLSTQGCGIYQLDRSQALPIPSTTTDEWVWENGYFTFRISPKGCWLNQRSIGRLLLEKDRGDTYSADPEPFAPPPQVKIVHLATAAGSGIAVVKLAREINHKDIRITTSERIFLNQTPIVDWQMQVDAKGSDYRLRVCFDTEERHHPVHAKMPYDFQKRSRVDCNYFGRSVPKRLKPLLMAAREVDCVTDFPFQGLVALGDAKRTRAMLARGLREYAVDQSGTIAVTLKRSVQWLAKGDLRTRVGDAGPCMYTPGARDQRNTRFELGFIDLAAPLRSEAFLKWFYLFEYGYLCFNNTAFKGQRRRVRLWNDTLPWSGIQSIGPGRSLIRVYNPYDQPHHLAGHQRTTDPFATDQGMLEKLAPNQIAHLLFTTGQKLTPPASGSADLIDLPAWPVGPDHGSPQLEQMEAMQQRIRRLQQTRDQTRVQLTGVNEEQAPRIYHTLCHQVKQLDREILEQQLSILLNRLTLEGPSAALEEEIRTIGRKTNLARRHRRTYDYILALFSAGEEDPIDEPPQPKTNDGNRP